MWSSFDDVLVSKKHITISIIHYLILFDTVDSLGKNLFGNFTFSKNK